MLGKALFHKYIGNSEYFKYINIGMEVLRGRKYYKEVILWQCRNIRTPLTIKSRMGLNKGIRAPLTIRSRIGLGRYIRVLLIIRSRMGFSKNIAWAVIEKASITIFG